MPETNTSECELAQAHLQRARESLIEGDAQAALTSAQDAFSLAQESGDRADQAAAKFLLGSAYELDSRLKRANLHYEEASLLFHQQGLDDAQGEALGAMSYTSAALGGRERALALAQRAFELRQDNPDQGALSQVLNQLGMAHAAMQQFEDAERILEAAAWYAEVSRPDESPAFHSVCNLCLNEIQRIVATESSTGQPQGLGKLADLVRRAHRTMSAQPLEGYRARHYLGVMLYNFACCFIEARRERLDAARDFAQRTRESLALRPKHHWAHAFDSFAHLYVALAAQDFKEALHWAQLAPEQAAAGEHLALAAFAQRMHEDLRAKLNAAGS